MSYDEHKEARLERDEAIAERDALRAELVEVKRNRAYLRDQVEAVRALMDQQWLDPGNYRAGVVTDVLKSLRRRMHEALEASSEPVTAGPEDGCPTCGEEVPTGGFHRHPIPPAGEVAPPAEQQADGCVCPDDYCLGTDSDSGLRVECAACLALDPELDCLRPPVLPLRKASDG